MYNSFNCCGKKWEIWLHRKPTVFWVFFEISEKSKLRKYEKKNKIKKRVKIIFIKIDKDMFFSINFYTK